MTAEQELIDFVTAQRWFGSKTREVIHAHVVDRATLREDAPRLELQIVELGFDTGRHETYQLLADGGFDAIADPQHVRELVQLIRAGRPLPAGAGVVEFGSIEGHTGLALTLRDARTIGREQSNTSIVFDEELILKVFRRLEAGVNPELEVLHFLTERGFENIAQLVGWYGYAGEPMDATLGILQRFVPDSQDGWQLALELVQTDPAEFVRRLRRLGEVTGQMHTTLGSDSGDAAFAAEEASTESLGLLTASIDDEIGSIFIDLPYDDDRLEPIRGRGEEVRERLRMLTQIGGVGRVIRHHGDFHLGQVLWSDNDWVIIDFEGEPARALPERRRKRSPLRDVAGMLRSLAYVQSAIPLLRGGEPPVGWEADARNAFLEGYRATVDVGLIPTGSSFERLLALFELEKAVYELRYELNNRPDWGGIPVAGIMRMLEEDLPCVTAFGELDIWLARAGRHEQLYDKLGAHPVEGGVRFAVWAPNATQVDVVGDFNAWQTGAAPLRPVDETGIWEGVVSGAAVGERYKYSVDGREKADPLAFEAEVPPNTASVVFESTYAWGDDGWLDVRRAQQPIERPLSIYEVHAPSWRHGLGWRELAEQLTPYVVDLGFTHVELLPVMHHPFAGSWGYQVTSYYAPLATLGSPDDFRFFVDTLHQAGVGVILDWVPAHFPRDDWALARFDGTALYEHDDPRRGAHPDWGTLVFNLGRTEVQNFLLANALFWLREYHADGIRVDAVASMLYLDYSRKEGEWVPNRFGGREDLDAVEFLKELNVLVHAREPGVICAAEESTAWPGVSRPTYVGGLGFGFKWNLGWMNDTLGYFEHEPVHRRFHHHELTFSLVYAWNENFILPLSHDEVVHGKRSLLGKMPGDRWQQLANLRALYAYMWAHPGKQLLFMGGELATPWEWTHNDELPWWLLDHAEHGGVRDLVRDLNAVYRETPALWGVDFSHDGFGWLEPNDSLNNVLAFQRLAADGSAPLVCVANLSPMLREQYRVGVPVEAAWREVLNTDSTYYGGTGVGNLGEVAAEPLPWHGQPISLELTVPPLGVLWLRPT